VGRTLLSAAVAVDSVSPKETRIKIGGQECPPYIFDGVAFTVVPT
jgi:hypothetical protein